MYMVFKNWKMTFWKSDIFKACKEGKLTSIQWLIDKENVDKNLRVEDYKNDLLKDDTPIHIASKNDHLQIVHYLIQKQNIDKDIKGNGEYTLLHCACEKVIFQSLNILFQKVQMSVQKIHMEIMLFILHQLVVFFQLLNI